MNNYIINQQKSLTVTNLVNLIKDSLENWFINFWVKGEISNLTYSSSGHYYFNLKDNKSQVKCVIFKFTANDMNLKLAEGQEVELTGRLTLYSPRGDLQIIVHKIIEISGLGKLYAKFELLKKKLQEEGYFSDIHKKKIPKFPKKIGIITSIDSAAIFDVITTIGSRNPSIEIIIYPCLVQGSDSVKEIYQAINIASKRQEVDTLILCRGGGSIEDLWSFNEEMVVKAIYNCNIPIVCGIGHESDYTLVDFVSDIRAPTPTGAAQLAIPDKNELLEFISSKEKLIINILKNKIFECNQNLDYVHKYFFNINSFLSIKFNKLKEINTNLNNLLLQKIYLVENNLNNLINSFEQNKLNINNYFILLNKINYNLNIFLKNNLNIFQNKLLFLNDILIALSPKKILDRGFSIIKNSKGEIIKNSKNLNVGNMVFIQFAKGSSNAKIISNDNEK